MRYTILRPVEPTDPRGLSFKSMEDLRVLAPSFADCDLEREAANRVRALYPDAVAMPVPVKLGSGEAYLLGVLPSIDAQHDPAFRIPFVLFVQAVSQHAGDQAILKRRGQFSRGVWKCPVIAPSIGEEWERSGVELRGTNLEQPMRLQAIAFRRARSGNVVLHLRLDEETEMSIELLEPLPLLPINVVEEFKERP